jgi:HAD superfamily hydrolase (TIGR01459 family)
VTYPPRTTLAELVSRYDVFFLDQFGVLRDDARAYPGAVDALRYLKAAGKTVVILSNSGRSGAYNADRLALLGFARSDFDHFVTSGDVACAVLSGSRSGLPARGRCLTISSGYDRHLLDCLRFQSVDTAADADLIVISGSNAESVSMETYRDILLPAAAKKLACVCTNPDTQKLANGSTVPGAGAIARLYEELGGTVRWFGKPHGDIYRHALALCGNPPAPSVVCIGDSVEHDIVGARGAGLDSVLVETGIAAGSSERERFYLMRDLDAPPTFTMSAFDLER